MAAGYGTRLEPLTLSIPKPMMPVCNTPIMEHNLRILKEQGFIEAAANLHYYPKQIQEYFGHGEDFGIGLKYSFEEKLLGTAGGVRKMLDLFPGNRETSLIISSDALTDIDLKQAVSFHKEKKSLFTLLLYPVEDVEHFGVVITDKNNRITFFQEKPKKEEARSNLVNTGIYIVEPEVLEMIPENTFYDFAKNLFPILLQKQLPFFGIQVKGYWSDIGTLSQLKQANFDTLLGRVKFGLPANQIKDQVFIGKNTRVEKGAQIKGPTVIGDHCFIGANAQISQSLIFGGTTIKNNSQIVESIIADNCQIESNVKIEKGSVVASYNHIKQNLPAFTKLVPGQQPHPNLF